MKVALDIARDLKSSNIWLDSNFHAKISNFALATTELHAKNKVNLSGASGYLALEYLSDGIFNLKQGCIFAKISMAQSELIYSNPTHFDW
ncbi:hypothetical protein L1987_32941 [Smallanthus sonchifolius]|uniref:Uncharacterized protein n=1 Tax=Smallanthus sonchifolius TaxID=185202 RepID=A0ACB9HP62_9ASTR|nr:hypothetical protein L1987_32941 [Smallanthus sonchifolius]